MYYNYDSTTCLILQIALTFWIYFFLSFFPLRFSYAAFSDSNIIALAVDTALYIAKKNSPVVEVWDKKTEKLCELIDCVHFLK